MCVLTTSEFQLILIAPSTSYSTNFSRSLCVRAYVRPSDRWSEDVSLSAVRSPHRSRASLSTSPSPMRSLCSDDEKDVAASFSSSHRSYGLVNANATANVNVSAHRTLANIEREVAALRHALSADLGATQESGACAMRCFGSRFLLLFVWNTDS